MGTLKRQIVTRPIPDGAVITQAPGKKGGEIATWTSKGKKHVARLNKKGDRISCESGSWIACYSDANGAYRQVSTGCRDKQAAQAKLVQLLDEASKVKAKIFTSTELQVSKHSEKPLAEHIEDFLSFQKQRGTSKIRVKAYDTRLKESMAGCGWSELRDLSSDELSAWLYRQETGERKMGPTVYNGFVEVWQAFGIWCLGKRSKKHFSDNRRLLSNPFEHFGKRPAESDRKRKARALTEDELVRLLDAAKRRPIEDAKTVRRGANKGQQIIELSTERTAKLERLGAERALIYKTLILTGLRLNELRTLTVGRLSFGDVMSIRLDAAKEKNRKGSTLPLRSDLAVRVEGMDQRQAKFV